MMEVSEAIRNRKSVRRFSDAKVSDAAIKELLELAAQAPSAGNTQEWRFVVVRERETKQRLSEAYMIGRKYQLEAPVIIVVCADMEAIGDAYGERGKSLYAFQDTAAAVENMLLAAAGMGLATCWLGAFNEQAVRNALAIPERIRPVAMITLGYAGENIAKNMRKPLAEAAFSEIYGNPFK